VQVEQGGVIHIINEGPVVPPEALAGLKRRFIRGQTPSAGAGLGLAIAETIMAQTGGRLDLFSPAPGHDGGFEARLITKTAMAADLAQLRRFDLCRKIFAWNGGCIANGTGAAPWRTCWEPMQRWRIATS
jgi:signal transduction histidine kinase